MTAGPRPVTFLFLAAACLVTAPAKADSWAGPQVTEVFSASRDHFVRVTPGKALGDTVGFAGSRQGPLRRGRILRAPARPLLPADEHCYPAQLGRARAFLRVQRRPAGDGR